jgi:exo-beta-1,3-glucanase (GH17 family)
MPHYSFQSDPWRSWGWLLALVLLAGWLTVKVATKPDTTAWKAGPWVSLPCVSYAPFRRPGDTPIPQAPGRVTQAISAAQILEDLNLIKQISPCVRTYGVDHGLDLVPGLAKQVGLRVKLGAWISSDPVTNQAQLTGALALTQAFPEVIDELIVGNEVLLRGDLSVAQLRGLIAQAQAATSTPISYADVWEFWLKHESLSPAVDRIAVHILPYWENDPIGVDGASAHVVSTLQRIRNHFAPKAVWVAETGWPSIGRQRGDARPGISEQRQFLRMLVSNPDLGREEFNVIEAFDQPWKKRFEGSMGGGWGVFNNAGDAKPAISQASLTYGYGAAAIAASLILGLIACWCTPNGRGREQALEGALVVVLSTLAGILIAHYASAWSRAPAELALWLIAAIGLNGMAWVVWSNRSIPTRAWATGIGLAAICAYLIVFVAHPRYLGFPVDLLWLFLAAHWLDQSPSQVPGLPSEKAYARRSALVLCALALIAIGLACAMLWNEGSGNGQALEAWLVVTAIGIGVIGKVKSDARLIATTGP